MRRSTLLVMLSLCALTLLPPAAGAAIKLGRSIKHIRIGQTQAQVDRLNGTPLASIRSTGPLGARLILRYPEVEVTFDGGNRVTGLMTTSRRQRTARNVGVGSRKRAVRKAHKHARCDRGPAGVCTIGRKRPKVGQKITTFVFSKKRVVSVEIIKIL
ncbi:MAG: hypothetical protein ACE5EV_00640 [Gaiellales bacterium]